jgi:hypothetical protein
MTNGRMKTRVPNPHRAAFTLVELLAASFVMTTALLGVYTVMKHALEIENRAAGRWVDRASAEAIAEHLVETLEHSINSSALPAIVAGRDDATGKSFLLCLGMGPGCEGGIEQAGLKRSRYRWNFGDNEHAGTIELQTMFFAGSRNITPIDGLDELDEKTLWSRIPATVIGRQVGGLSIQFKPLTGDDAAWQDQWKGPVGKVAISVRVSAGGQTVETIVVPRADTVLVGTEGS